MKAEFAVRRVVRCAPEAGGRAGASRIESGFPGHSEFSKCLAPRLKTGGITFLQRFGLPHPGNVAAKVRCLEIAADTGGEFKAGGAGGSSVPRRYSSR